MISSCYHYYLSRVHVPHYKPEMTSSDAMVPHVVNETVCRRNTMFTELSLGCWSSGHKNMSMYQVSPSTVFFFISYMRMHAPFIMYCLRLFVDMALSSQLSDNSTLSSQLSDGTTAACLSGHLRKTCSLHALLYVHVSTCIIIHE